MWQIYDRVLASGRVETLVFLTLITAAALLALGALDAVRGHILGRMGRWLDRRLTPDLISASLRRTLHGEAAGGQALRDLATVRNVLAGPGVSALLDAPWAPVFIVIIALMHPLLGLVAVGAALALLALAVANEAASRRPLQRRGAALDPRDAAGRGGDSQRRRRPGHGHAAGLHPALVGAERGSARPAARRPAIATRPWSASPSSCACSSRS